MNINVGKTECMHVCRQEKVSITSAAEAQKVCKFKCIHEGCGWVFGNKRGQTIHQSKCKHKDTFVVEKILEHEATTQPASRTGENIVTGHCSKSNGKDTG